MRAGDAAVGPLQVAVGRRIREHEPARRVGPVAGDDAFGIDDVPFRLRHLLGTADLHRPPVRLRPHPPVAVLRHLARFEIGAAFVAIGLVDHHALGEQAREGFVEIQIAAAAQRPREEARIEQVQHGVLDAADILIHRHPVGERPPVQRRLVARRAEAQEIPAGIDEGIEGVGVAQGAAPAGRAGHALPGRVPFERVAGPVDGHVVGQRHGQVAFGDRHDAAIGAVDDGDGAAPVALARNPPVAQAVVDRAPGAPCRLQAPGHLLPGLLGGHAVEKVRIAHAAGAGIGLAADPEAGGLRAGGNHHRQHVQPVGAGEFQVALVVGGRAEDGAGAVVHQHEIGDIDRQPAAVEGVQRLQPGVVALLFGALDRLLAGAGAGAFGDEAGQRRIAGRQLGRQRVLGRDGHEAGAEDGVVAGGEDLQPVAAAGQREAHGKPFGAPHPVGLHQAHLVGPAFQAGQRVGQLVGEGGDLQHPLHQAPLFHRRAGTPAAPVDHLLVGEHRAVHRVPVDHALAPVHQAGGQEVQEQLLLVAEIAGMAGGDLARPVERKPHGFQLPAHGVDVGAGPVARVHAFGHGRVFRRQSEGVPAHGVEHVEAPRPLVAGHQVAHGVVADVAHVDAAAGIGKHLQHIGLGPAVGRAGAEAAPLLPQPLPARLGLAEVVGLACHGSARGSASRRRRATGRAGRCAAGGRG